MTHHKVPASSHIPTGQLQVVWLHNASLFPLFFQTTEGRSPVQILGVALLLCILACVPRSMLVFEPRFGPKHPKTPTHVAQRGDIMIYHVYILLYNAWPVNRFVPTEVGY